MLNTLARMFVNCCFLPHNGEEVFPGTLYDGTPHIMLKFCFKENKKYAIPLIDELEKRFLKRFMGSSISKDFVHICFSNKENNKVIHYFYKDYGENVEAVQKVCRQLISEVYFDVDVHHIPNWVVGMNFTKEEAQSRAKQGIDKLTFEFDIRDYCLNNKSDISI